MFQVKSCFSSEKLIQTSLYTLTMETGKVLPKKKPHPTQKVNIQITK